MGASVRARLLAISKANGQVFELVLNRYAVERLLYRLSVSAHARRFVLKGATLLMTWLAAPHRGTRDLDLLGFGDALEPEPETLDYPVLLDVPAPQLRGYARETVIAEKFEAITSLGRDNTRMKDFHDIWILSRAFTFTDDRLARAISATFARRGTPIPTAPPDALAPAFAADDRKRAQWIAFIETVDVDPGDLATILADLSAFLMPHATAAQSM